MEPPAARRADLRRLYPSWSPRPLHQVFADAAQRWPQRPLVVTDEGEWTYSDVVAWSERLAAGLADHGVGPGDRVALSLANLPVFLPLKLALSRLGAVAVPLNFLYRTDELGYVLRQSRSSVLVSMTGFAGIDQQRQLDTLVPGWDSPGWPGDGELRRILMVPVDGAVRPGARALADIERDRPAVGVLPDDAPPASTVSDIFYTSGTTGSPKGVVLTHDALLRSAYSAALTRAFEDGRRILFALPLYHLFAYVEALLACVWVGGSVVLQPAFSPAAYLRGVERHGATEILAVPTMAIAVLEHPDAGEYDVSSLTAIMCAAAAAPTWVWDRARTVLGVTDICTGWGMTETGAGITITRPEDTPDTHSATVGRVKEAGGAGLDHAPDLHSEVRTVDPQTGAPLPAGAEGEIVVRTPSMMREFWEKPEETAETLVDGWLRTGDLGRVGPDGYLRLTGRSKELYKSGGELVMPTEIEDLLSDAPGVSQAFAVGLQDERWGEIGCAVVVREPGSTVTAAELDALCRERLARFKVPKRYVFLQSAELPATPTGKVQKFRLAALVQERAAEPVERTT